MDDEELRDLLGPFFKLNPESELGESRGARALQRPWGDPTLVFRMKDPPEELIEALNHLFLPSRFTAIWHTDNRRLEVIWSLVPEDSPYIRRHFQFSFRGREYDCSFGPASQRLLALARAARPIMPATQTRHRNLPLIGLFLRQKEEHPDPELATITIPSFWLDGLETWDDEIAVELVRHLNFFMRYFDPGCPIVMVHPGPKGEDEQAEIPASLAVFPEGIAGRPLDPYLLGLWESAHESADPLRRFLHLYQILEYCAFYHMEASVLRTVGQVLRAPEAPYRVDQTARELLDVLAEDKRRDEAKIVALIAEVVDPNEVWQHIAPNVERFCVLETFDGGFMLQPLLKEGWGVDDFRAHWIPAFPDAVRKIRNSIVHAREQRLAGAIAPTQENFNRLTSWIIPLEVTAMRAMLHSSP